MRFRKFTHQQSGKLVVEFQGHDGPEGDKHPWASLEFNDEAHMQAFTESLGDSAGPVAVALRKMIADRTDREETDRDTKTGEVKIRVAK